MEMSKVPIFSRSVPSLPAGANPRFTKINHEYENEHYQR